MFLGGEASTADFRHQKQILMLIVAILDSYTVGHMQYDQLSQQHLSFLHVCCRSSVL